MVNSSFKILIIDEDIEALSISEHALKAEGFIRTYNPLHSFAVWGKNSEEIKNLQNGITKEI